MFLHAPCPKGQPLRIPWPLTAEISFLSSRAELWEEPSLPALSWSHIALIYKRDLISLPAPGLLYRVTKLLTEALARSLPQSRCTRSVLRVPLPSPNQQHTASPGSGGPAGLSSGILLPAAIFTHSFSVSLNYHLKRVLQ